MSPKRGDRAAPPRIGKEYDIRFDNTDSASGGRIWYLIDDTTHTVWITYAGNGHPKATDR